MWNYKELGERSGTELEMMIMRVGNLGRSGKKLKFMILIKGILLKLQTIWNQSVTGKERFSMEVGMVVLGTGNLEWHININTKNWEETEKKSEGPKNKMWS